MTRIELIKSVLAFWTLMGLWFITGLLAYNAIQI